MPKCPNCSYTLNLHPTSRRYKCSKCKSYFPQKEIDEKEFREFNNQERIEVKKEVTKEFNRIRSKVYAENNKEKMVSWRKGYYKKNKLKFEEAHKKWKIKKKQEDPDYIANKSSEYYDQNKEKILARNRYAYKSGQVFNLDWKPKKTQDIDIKKAENRIKQGRNKQKLLALKTFSDGVIRAYSGSLSSNSPTMLLS